MSTHPPPHTHTYTNVQRGRVAEVHQHRKKKERCLLCAGCVVVVVFVPFACFCRKTGGGGRVGGGGNFQERCSCLEVAETLVAFEGISAALTTVPHFLCLLALNRICVLQTSDSVRIHIHSSHEYTHRWRGGGRERNPNKHRPEVKRSNSRNNYLGIYG